MGNDNKLSEFNISDLPLDVLKEIKKTYPKFNQNKSSILVGLLGRSIRFVDDGDGNSELVVFAPLKSNAIYEIGYSEKHDVLFIKNLLIWSSPNNG